MIHAYERPLNHKRHDRNSNVDICQDSTKVLRSAVHRKLTYSENLLPWLFPWNLKAMFINAYMDLGLKTKYIKTPLVMAGIV